MRKVMIMASMLAMVMLAASPALAQTQSSEQNAQGANINQLSQQCQNVVGDINIDANQEANGGDQYAAGSGTNVNVQEISQDQNISVNIVQNCIQEAEQQNVINVETPAVSGDDQYDDGAGAAPGDDQYDNGDDQYAGSDDDSAAGAVSGAGAAAPAGGAASAAEGAAAQGGAVAVLPDTGGASLFTLGAGALLVAGGLLARRIIR